MRNNIFRLFFLSNLLCFSFSLFASEPYQIVDVEETVIGRFTVTETTVQVGDEPVNRFIMHRWARTNLRPQRVRGVLLMQSGLGGNFRLFELDDDASKRDAFTAFFARRNFVVYGYSPRATLIPPGTCESGQIDCAPMADWNLQSFVDDLTFIRGEIANDFPDKKVVIGGLSLGAIDTIAVINQNPHDYDGAIIWEGMLYSEDPQVLALNQGYCAFQENLLNNGVIFDGQSLPGFKQIAALAQNDPDGISPLAPIFGLPGGTTNYQLFVFALTQPAPGPATMPVPDYILTAGDFQTGTFDFIDPDRILTDIANFSNYVPNAAVRDISCSLAGIETAYTNNLDAFQGPVLAIGGGLGFGAYMQDNLNLLANADVTFRLTEAFAHVDHIFLPTPLHRLYVELPVLIWFNREVR